MRRFSEHYRIDNYLKNLTIKNLKVNTLQKDENILSNFPIGLIVISKELFEDKLEFINRHACKLFGIKENANTLQLMEKFSEYVQLNNNSLKTKRTLKDIINNCSLFNYELDNFISFESVYSKSTILYIKINEIDNEKYIVIDKYDKFLEERKYIELNLIKTINYQYLHTLYHELNNPLNALLALSGEAEKTKFLSSDISNSKIDNKISLITNKNTRKVNSTIYSHFKRDKRIGPISLSNSKLPIYRDIFGSEKKKKSLDENNDLYTKIPLLVSIIKIFIKNFILYLKTRADNLLMLKKEYNLYKEASDIMNVVEVSEYERELTNHKLVKIDLQYIFDLYFQKFLCLFKYKEIEFETNFDKLKNLYVVTDEFNFIYFIRQIFTYLYYMVPKKNGFIFEYEQMEEEEENKIKIIIKKRNSEIISNIKDEQYESMISNTKSHKQKRKSLSDMNQIIQTKEMTKEVLYSMSKKLNFKIEIYDLENNENKNNIYFCISIPIQRKDKSEDEDDFKDEDINEMVQKDAVLLEDKLKRQFPNYRDKNNNSNNFEEIYNKFEKNYSDSSIQIQKNKEKIKIDSNKNLMKIKGLSNFQYLNGNNENLKKIINKSTNTFLNKCLKKKDIIKHKGKIKDNYLKSRHLRGHVCNCLSRKNVFYNEFLQKNETKIKNHRCSGIFTKINNLGLSEELDFNDESISDITDKKIKNDKIFKNKNILSKENSENNKPINNSTTIKDKNIKTPYIITDTLEGKNKNINININNNNTINIINDNSLQKNNYIKNITINKEDKKSSNFDSKNKKSLFSNSKRISCKKEEKIHLPDIEQKLKQEKRFSQKVTSKINSKECMTFFGEYKKETNNKENNNTIGNSNLNVDDNLFIENSEQKSNKVKSNFLNNEFTEIECEEMEESSEIISEENDLEEESQSCNCSDILIVDDEEFNVMASQKMIKI